MFNPVLCFLGVILVENDLLRLADRRVLGHSRALGLLDRLLRQFLTDPVVAQANVAVALHTGTGRNQLTDDDILLQTDQVIHLSVDGGLRQDLGGLLEGRRG